jgi:uncharacterized protein
MTRIFYMLAFWLASTLAGAQKGELIKDIERLLSINGCTAPYDLAFDQMVKHYKSVRNDTPDYAWTELRVNVYEKEISLLQQKMVPVYMKYFTQDEIRELIRFYETPLGKKLSGTLVTITKENMQISHNWSMDLGHKMNDYLQQKGY